jgi:H+-translocating NAD(P) transhydrogenase subunit beta
VNGQVLESLTDISYIVAAILFIFGIKMLSSPATARRGNLVSAVGMLIAVVATLVSKQIVSYEWIMIGAAIGAFIGAVAATKVPMTAMPEFVALFNGFGGIASLLVGWSEYEKVLRAQLETLAWYNHLAVYLAVLIGGVTFTGSMVAYAKLAQRIPARPLLFPGQQVLNALLMLAAVAGGVYYLLYPLAPDTYWVFIGAVAVSGVLGILATVPIGGADMPVVISLLNSYSGLAACAAGFIIENTVLIVSGALVGASGIILTSIMCKAMNRSLANVLFSGFGAAGRAIGAKVEGEAKPINPSDAYYLLEAAGSVVFVPGYGMAVAQAQHVVRELGAILEENGAEVRYAVHPVAGRMPGHMNVLLAEANVPYDQLVEMADINPVMPNVDVAIVIGANDVVNPAAREDATSSIYGMPIINVDHARVVLVLKRSLASGFAGVENPLFFKENTRMLFGDAKQSITALIAEFKES